MVLVPVVVVASSDHHILAAAAVAVDHSNLVAALDQQLPASWMIFVVRMVTVVVAADD
jgi:hypothetical protein